MDHKALQSYMRPILDIIGEDGVNELSVNSVGGAYIEKRGDISYVEIPELDFEHLRHLSLLIAQSTEQVVSAEKPLLSATIPGLGYRIQIVFPPACESGSICMSIRKPATVQLTLDDYEKMGAFKKVVVGNKVDKLSMALKKMLKEGDIKKFLNYAIVGKKNLIISGGTSTGKTTFTNACLRTIPSDERIITVEDAREIVLDQQPNKVHLIASKGGQGRANVTTQDLIEACLRLRPDRIIVGELRGAEAFSFLRAINTGHPGSISTLHADTPEMAIEQLKLMVLQAGLNIPEHQIKNYIINVVDIIVQLKRADKGVRYISDILFTKDLITE